MSGSEKVGKHGKGLGVDGVGSLIIQEEGRTENRGGSGEKGKALRQWRTPGLGQILVFVCNSCR